MPICCVQCSISRECESQCPARPRDIDENVSLSDAEKASAAAGTLDIICGFTVIDDHYRMIVLEVLLVQDVVWHAWLQL